VYLTFAVRIFVFVFGAFRGLLRVQLLQLLLSLALRHSLLALHIGLGVAALDLNSNRKAMHEPSLEPPRCGTLEVSVAFLEIGFWKRSPNLGGGQGTSGVFLMHGSSQLLDLEFAFGNGSLLEALDV
jgi:hypothetical protein